jgi:hypothetical protein
VAGSEGLAVGRLHARYVDVGPGDAERLDAALSAMVDGALDQALDATPVVATDAYAVCIPELHVAVELDLRHAADRLADEWAGAVAADLVCAARAVLEGGGGVVWRREVDAVVDLVRCVAVGDERHRWAWEQVGLVAPGGGRLGSLAVAAALVARAELAPGVLRATADLRPHPLDAAGWLAVATALDAVSHPGPGGAVASADGRDEWPVPRSVPPAVEGVVGQVVDLVPADAWWAAGARRTSLVRLALAVVAPGRARDHEAVAAVMAAGGSTAVATDAAVAVGGMGRPDEDRVAPVAAAADAAVGEALGEVAARATTSEWAGACYLVHDLLRLPWPDDGLAPVEIAAIVAAVTGAPIDDPAVRLVASADHLPDEELAAATPLRPEAVALAAALRDRIGERLGDGDDDGIDHSWIWQRRAELAVQPGWIEVRYALDDVDVRLRRAGLDLHPGYVWWLGSVVRFEHV